MNRLSDKNKLALSIGAYIATVEQWKEFGREWKDLLGEYGIEMMHATDLEASQGEFRGWEKDRNELWGQTPQSPNSIFELGD